MKILKRTACLMMALLTLLTVLPIPAHAASIHDILFDSSYYAAGNPDVVKALGTSHAALYQHYNQYGKREGRRPSDVFSPQWYINAYPDLKAAFGNNWEAAYNHFVSYGIAEGRQGSPEFNVTHYKNTYSDLRVAFGTSSSDNWKYLEHWKNYGKREGRIAVAGGTASSTSNTSPSSSSSSPSSNASYFQRYTGNSTSIVTALASIGADSSYTYRTRIAAANNITNYSGSASQNTAMLNLLKNGSLIKPDGSSNSSSSSGTTSSSGGSVVTHTSYNVSVSPKSWENKPHYTNAAGQRSASALNTVLDQFNVTSNSRYQRTSSATYCNIFAWDATSALGCEIPHWTRNNVPATHNTSGAGELNVNATCNWLNSYGSKYGWYTVSASTAQQRANSGYPAIAIWKNPSGASGHIAMVRPEGNGYSYSSSKGPVIAQAGANNYNYTNVSTGFGSGKMSAIVYWTHA